MKKLKQHNPLEGSFSAVVGDEFITGKVSKLVELSKDYPTIKLPLSKIPNIPHHSEPEKNIYILNSSLSYPIIVMVDEDGEVERVLDGNHRIQKALYLGKDIINAKLIPKKDMKRFFDKSNLQESIRRILREESNEIIDLPPFKSFNNDWNEVLKFTNGRKFRINEDIQFLKNNNVETLGNLVEINGRLGLDNCNIKSLGKLQYVGGNLVIQKCNELKSLDNLIQVDGEYCSIYDCENLESLGNLQFVKNYLQIAYCPKLKTLGNLTKVGRNLKIENCDNLDSFGNLKQIGYDLIVTESPKITNKYNPEQLRKILNIKRRIQINTNLYDNPISLSRDNLKTTLFQLLNSADYVQRADYIFSPMYALPLYPMEIEWIDDLNLKDFYNTQKNVYDLVYKYFAKDHKKWIDEQLELDPNYIMFQFPGLVHGYAIKDKNSNTKLLIGITRNEIFYDDDNFLNPKENVKFTWELGTYLAPIPGEKLDLPYEDPRTIVLNDEGEFADLAMHDPTSPLHSYANLARTKGKNFTDLIKKLENQIMNMDDVNFIFRYLDALV